MSSGVKFIIDGLSDIDDPGDAKPYIRVTDGTGVYVETGTGERSSKRSVGKFKFPSDNELVFHGCFPPFTVQVYFDEGGVSSCYDGVGSINELADETFICELLMDGDEGMPVGEVMGRYEITSVAENAVESRPSPAEEDSDCDDAMMMEAHPESTVADGEADDDAMMMVAHPESTIADGEADDDAVMMELSPGNLQASASVVEGVAAAASAVSPPSEPAPEPVPTPTSRPAMPVTAKLSKTMHKKEKLTKAPSKAATQGFPVAVQSIEPQNPLPSWANEVSIDQLRGAMIEQTRKDLLSIGDLKMLVSVNNVAIFSPKDQAGLLAQADNIGVSMQVFPKHESMSVKNVTLKSGQKCHSSSSDAGSLSVFNFAGVGKPMAVMLPSGFVRSKLFVQGNFPWLQLSVKALDGVNPADCLYGGLYVPSLRFLHDDSVASSNFWTTTVDTLVTARQVSGPESSSLCYAVVSLAIKVPLSCLVYSSKIPSIPKGVAMCCEAGSRTAMVLSLRLRGLFASEGSLAAFMGAGATSAGGEKTGMGIYARLITSGSFSASSSVAVTCESFALGVSFSPTGGSAECKTGCLCKLAVPSSFPLVVNDVVEIMFVPSEAESSNFVAHISLLSLITVSQSAVANTGPVLGLKKSKPDASSGAAPSPPKKFACPVVLRSALSQEDISFPTAGTAVVSPFTDSLSELTLVGESSLEEVAVPASDGKNDVIHEIHQLRDNIARQRADALAHTATVATTLERTTVQQSQSALATPRGATALANSMPPLVLNGTRKSATKHVSGAAPTTAPSVSGLLHCYVKGFICNDADASLSEVLATMSSSAAQDEEISPTGITDSSGCLTALNHMCKAKTISWSLAESTPGSMSFKCAVSNGEGRIQSCIGMLDMTPLIIGHSAPGKKLETTQPYCVYLPLLASKPAGTSTVAIDTPDVVGYILVGVLFQKLSVSELIQHSKKGAKSVDDVCVRNVRLSIDNSWAALIQQYAGAVRGGTVSPTKSYAPLNISVDKATSCGKNLCSGGLFSARDYETLFSIASGSMGTTCNGDGVANGSFLLRFRSCALDSKNRSLVTTKDIVGKFDESDCLVWSADSTSLELYQSQSTALTTSIHVQLLRSNSADDPLLCLAHAHVALSLQDLEMGLPITMTVPLRSAGKGSGGSKLVTLSLCFSSPTLVKTSDVSSSSATDQSVVDSAPSTLRLDIVDGYISGMDTVQRSPFFEFAFIERGYFRALADSQSAAGEDGASIGTSLSDVIDNSLNSENVLRYRTPFLSAVSEKAPQTASHGSAMDQHVAMGLSDFDTVMATVDEKERQWKGIFTMMSDVDSSIWRQLGSSSGSAPGASATEVDLLILCRDANLAKCPIVGYNILPLEDIPVVKDRATVWRHLNRVEDPGNEADGAVSRANLLDQLDELDQNDGATRFVSNGLAGGDELGSIKLALRMFNGNVPLPIPDPPASRADYQAVASAPTKPWPNNGVGCVKMTFYSILEKLVATTRGSAVDSQGKGAQSNPTVSPLYHVANSTNAQTLRKMQLELDEADTLALELDCVEIVVLPVDAESADDVLGVFKFNSSQGVRSAENSITFPVPTSNVILALSVQTDRYKTFYTTEIDLKKDLLVAGLGSTGKDDADGGLVFMERSLVENTAGSGGAKKKRPLRVSKVQKLYLEVSFIPFVKCTTKVQMNSLTITNQALKKTLAKPKGEGTGATATRFAFQHSNSFAFSASDSSVGSEIVLPELDTFNTYCGFEPFDRSRDTRIENKCDNFLNMEISVSQLESEGGVPSLVGEVKVSHLFWLALRKVMSGSGNDGDDNGSFISYRVCLDLFIPGKVRDQGAAVARKAGRIDLTISMAVAQIPGPVVRALQPRPAGSAARDSSSERIGLLLKQAFVAADTDRSGSISVEELGAAFEKHKSITGVDDGDFEVVMQALSTLAPSGGGSDTSSKEIVQRIFSKIDIDGDGAVSWWEWMQILSSCLQGLDSNGVNRSPSAGNDAVILYLMAAAEKCKHASKWKKFATPVSAVLTIASYPTSAGGSTRAPLKRNLIAPGEPMKYKAPTAASGWIDPSASLARDDAAAGPGGVAKLHALITEMRSVNSTLARKLETAILDGQKMLSRHSRSNSPSSTGVFSASQPNFGSTANLGRTLEDPIDSSADPLDVTSAALRKMRDAEQKASVVEIALINERNRVLELKYELETLRASEEMNRESRTTKDFQYKSINSLKEREIAEAKKRLEAMEAARQRKNTATFMIVTFLKLKAIPELRRRLFAKKYGFLSWWLTGRATRWKYLRFLKLRQASATKMSKLIRGGLTRKELRKQREVVALLQRIARGHKQRNVFKKMKTDAREKFELSVFNKQFDSACIIQRCTRSFLEKCRAFNATKLKQLQEEEEAKRRAVAAEMAEAMRKSALALQRATRSYMSKLSGKRAAEEKARLALHTKCVMLFQKICRGRRARLAVRKIRLRKWYQHHGKSENLISKTKPTVRDLTKWTRASQGSYIEEQKQSRLVNPGRRSNNSLSGWWIRSVFHRATMELVVDDDEEIAGAPMLSSHSTKMVSSRNLSVSDTVEIYCNAYQYVAKSRLVRVFYFDFAKDIEVETHLPYDHDENTAWFLDKALAPTEVTPAPVKRRDPVTLIPSRRPDIRDICSDNSKGFYYVYICDGEECVGGSTQPNTLTHGLFKDHKQSVLVNADNFVQLEERDIVVLKIVDVDAVKKNITVVDFGSDDLETQDVIPFKSAELVWFTDSEAKVVHPPVFPKRGMSASNSKEVLSTAPSAATFTPIKPRGPRKPAFADCIGWKIKVNPAADDDDDAEEEEDVVGVVVATDARTKQLKVSFDLEANVGKDFVLYEEDLELIPYSSADIFWVGSLTDSEEYVVPTITTKPKTPHAAGEIAVEPVAEAELQPTPEPQPVVEPAAEPVAPEKSSNKSPRSPRKPDFEACVGWKIQVLEEHDPGEESGDELVGVVVATRDGAKQILVCFDMSLGQGDVIAEEELESIPYSSVDIKWMEGGHPFPSVKSKSLTKSASKGSKSSSASRLEALPAGTSALSMANALKEKVASIDENIFIQTSNLVAACPEQIVENEADVQLFQKQLVKPPIDSCAGYLVRILADTDGAPAAGGDGADILTDDTDIFGIVISNMGKKTIQVRFFHETTTSAHASSGIAGDDMSGVDLQVLNPAGESDEDMVDVLPYNSKGVIWYKNITA